MICTLKAFNVESLHRHGTRAFRRRSVRSLSLNQQAACIARFKDYVKGYVPDGRVLKHRVVGLITVGGATFTEWGALTLPGLQPVCQMSRVE